MTTFNPPPPQPTLSYNSPAPKPPRVPWGTGEIFCWTLILLLIATLLITSNLPLSTTSPTPVAQNDRVQFLVLARYIVGFHSIMHKLTPAAASTNPAAPSSEDGLLLDSVNRGARSPAEQLRAAIVEGEFEGPDSAITRLDALPNDPALRDDSSIFIDHYMGGILPEKSHKYLLEKYGWFADLAFAIGKPDSDPERAAVLSAAYRTFFALLGGTVLIFGAIVFGVVLLIRLFNHIRHHTAPPLAFNHPEHGGRALPVDRFPYLAGVTVYLAILLSADIFLQFVELPLAVRLAIYPLCFAAGALTPILLGQTWAHWRAAVGFHAPVGIRREILAGWKAYFTGLPIVALAFMVVLFLMRITGANPTHPIEQALNGSWPLWFAAFFLAAVWAPFTEEIMFRGMLFAHLRGHFRWLFSAVAMGLVFAIIHPQGLTVVPALATLAVVFAAIRESRASIFGSMAAHSLHNGFLIIFATLCLT